MAEITTTGSIDIDALKLGLAAYSKAKLSTLSTITTQAKASIDALLLTLSVNRQALQAELSNKGLESKEAALKAKLNISDKQIAEFTTRTETSISAQVQIGLLASSLSTSTDIDDEIYVNILFELNSYRYLIAEAEAATSRYTALSNYYSQVISAIASVLPTAQD